MPGWDEDSYSPGDMTKINWPQAFAEVGLLALGIALALLADSVLDGRQERAEETQYLEALQLDFEASRDEFERSLTRNRQTRDHNLRFLEVVAGPPGSVSPDSLSDLVEEAFWWDPSTPVLATYSDMVNSGDLRLIQSDTLRIEMARFAAYLDVSDQVSEEALYQWNQLQVPFLVQNLSVPRAYEGYYDGFSFPQGRHEPDETAFWGREFENILSVKVISLSDVLLVDEAGLDLIERILRLLEKELGAR